MRLFIFSAIMLSLSVQSPASQQGAAKQKQDVGEHHAATEAKPMLAGKSEAQSASSNTKQESAEQKPVDRLYMFYLVSGPAVGIVALGSAFLIWRQTVALQRIERAWITVKFELDISKATDDVVEGRLKYRNYGRSPAWIIATFFRFEFYQTIPNKPAPGEFGDPKAPPHTIGPGEERVVRVWLNLARYTPSTTMVMDGVLKYRDIFNRKRYTKFGFFLNKDDGTIDGLTPKEFHKFT